MSHFVQICEFGERHGQCRCASKDKTVITVKCNNIKHMPTDDCSICANYKGQIHPNHNASPMCQSAGHDHCTCAICF